MHGQKDIKLTHRDVLVGNGNILVIKVRKNDFFRSLSVEVEYFVKLGGRLTL